MKELRGRRFKGILAMALTVLLLCCVLSACAAASAGTADSVQPLTKAAAPDTTPETTVQKDSRWQGAQYAVGVATRAMWINDLITILNPGADAAAPANCAELFDRACALGVTDSVEEEPYAALTRRYVAETLVRAMDYHPKLTISAEDLDDDDEALLILVYYGYFIPDDDGNVYPDALITGDEYSTLKEEVCRCAALRGKRLLSFGDSIMQGVGNRGSGITKMIAEKYGMECADYSVSRATLGVYSVNSHVPDQIRAAIRARDTADLILLNGGTNDMLHVSRGTLTKSRSTADFNEKTFSGGLETSFALITQYWTDVPVLYVRAHNMAVCDDNVERIFGEYALKIAEKWQIPTVDIYEDTGFNAEDEQIRDRYTFYKEQILRTDSIHPTALGYARFYLPSVCEKIAELLAE